MKQKPITFHVPDSQQETTSQPKVELVLNDTTIHSLAELRQYFDPEEIMTYFMKGQLLDWLRQHYYEKEADAIAKIDCTQADCLQKICLALDVEYLLYQKMTAEERNKWNEKRRIVCECAKDPDHLPSMQLIALNQEDLAKLLDKQEKKIYLCNNSFSIPLRVSGVEYTNLGNATIENPYTKAQYEKAGIKMSDFVLPAEEDPTTAEFAKAAAISNGYDDFQETHTPLATAFHKRLKSRKLITPHHLSYNSSASGKFYTSKSECKKAREQIIRKAYDEAEKYITTGNSKSLVKEAAEFYSNEISSVFEDTRNPLETLCSMTGTKDLYDKLIGKVDTSYKSLLREFESELDDNRDYYNMYDFDYFIDQVEIEEHDHRIYDDFFSRTLETLLSKDSIEYTLTDLYSAIREMENDLNGQASTFYGAAFSAYQSYVSEIEDIINKIGTGLPAMDKDETIEDYLMRCCVKEAI